MGSDDHDYGSGGGGILNPWAPTCNAKSPSGVDYLSCINKPGHKGPHGDIRGNEWPNPRSPLATDD
jgi:hypothetical protein